MITPNKFISLDKSVLAKLDIIESEDGLSGIRELYRQLGHRFDSVDQFILALDVLYILDRLNVDFRTGTVSHVA